MALTYTEMNLFLRAGDDMRRAGFAPGVFVRFVQPLPAPQIPGYERIPYTPTTADLTANDWRRA